MKLSKIYSNSDIFSPVLFNLNLDGENFLNVIFAEAKAPENKDLDLHNLGKSLFIDLIDFTLLKGVTKYHFLYKHKNRFSGCKFYLEVYLDSGKYLTICRGVDDNAKISLMLHDKRNQNFGNCEKENWNHYNISIENAKKIIDSYFNLSIIKPWDYRQGISYFLRTQSDYDDYFQISKFVKGEDSSWKPYIAHILGIDSKPLLDKYKVEKEIEQLISEKYALSQDLNFDEKEFDKLNSIVEIETSELNLMSNKLDSFDFSEEEIRINKNLSSNIEYKLSILNDKLYNVNYDIACIESDLKQKTSFNLNEIKKLYDEAQLYIPQDLLNDYESLLDFNKQITRERSANLKKRIEILKEEQQSLINDIEELGKQRKICMEILNGENSLKKYKLLQKEFSTRNTKLINYQNQLDKLKKIKNLTSRINNLKTEKISLEDKISYEQTNQSETYKSIIKDFTEMSRKVFNKLVILNTQINGAGNLDFVISFKDGDSALDKETSESEGNTYKKILCVLFDLAILRQYYNKGFYHFVYHDGIFEELEPRKKEKLLEIIKESVDKYNIQYILTVIQSDLPVDKAGEFIRFNSKEEVLVLNDLGDEGRLFKMKEF